MDAMCGGREECRDVRRYVEKMRVGRGRIERRREEKRERGEKGKDKREEGKNRTCVI